MEAALDFLRKQGEWAGAWALDFVFLNINMPKINGWGVLDKMKSDPELRISAVAMWTIAEIEEYTTRSFEMGPSGIFTKPVDSQKMESQGVRYA